MAGPRTVELRADCTRCFGLCCVAPGFSRSADFAIDKPAGRPCPHLQPGFGCGIHAELANRGFRGCTVYDCFGAGQHVAQVVYRGRDWHAAPETAEQMFRVLGIVRQLHELLWYLDDALSRPAARGLHDDLRRRQAAIERLTRGSPADVAAVDVDGARQEVDPLLQQVSSTVRRAAPGAKADHRRADLVGRDLRALDLRAADLRGALLLGADLRGVDLRLADVIGADLRGADVRGADLRDALFLTQVQLNAARGDERTRIPVRLQRPPPWGGESS